METFCSHCGATRDTPYILIGAATECSYRPSIARLLDQWFGYKVEASDEFVRVLSPDGKEIDLLALHRRIQEDGPQQSTLYQATMSLWR